MSASIQEVESRDTPLGPALYIKIRRYDGKRMGWEAVHKAFSESYPGQWAVQVFPPEDALVNDANIYHLFVVGESFPSGLRIDWWRS